MRLTLNTCLCLMLLLTPVRLLAQAPPTILNGIAVHSEFGHELFIGALYSPFPLQGKIDSLDNIPQLRMELKILTPEGITVRRFHRIWHEAMLVNNDSALLVAQADNRILFETLFKDRLLANDHLVFSYQAKQGVTISLNNILLGKIPSDAFIKLLLNTWVGDVPLSSDYKNAILKASDIDRDLLSRFTNSKSTAERSQEIAGWLNTSATESPNNSKIKTSIASSASIKQTSSIASAASINTKGAQPTSTTLTAAPAQNEVMTQSSASAAQENKEAEAQASLSAEIQSTRKLYVALLLEKIRSKTRYPTRANELGQGGSLRIAVEIDRSGNILALRFVEESPHELLNQAAINAIKQSQPLPPMPDALPGTRFELRVPISFVPGK